MSRFEQICKYQFKSIPTLAKDVDVYNEWIFKAADLIMVGKNDEANKCYEQAKKLTG